MRKNDIDYDLLDKIFKDSEIQISDFQDKKEIEVEISKLVTNPYQPRIEIDQNKLDNLVKSIQENGLLQPIAVTEINNEYIIVFGHRRVAAYKKLKKPTIRAILLENIGHDQLAFSSYEENAQRVNLQPIEHALFLQKILDKKLVKNQEELSKKIGKSPSQISRILSVLKLPDSLREKIQKDSFKDIRVLSELNKLGEDIVEEVYEKIKGLTRKEALEIIKNRTHGISFKNTIRVYQEKMIISLKNLSKEKIKKIKKEIQKVLDE